MATPPRLSVLMSVYNGGPYLAEAVTSVLSGPFADLEFVVVDNCSTDGSVAYLAGIDDPRLRLIRNAENLGQTRALNVGLRACTAPLVARLDADDVSLPDRFAAQAEALDAAGDLVLVGGQALRIGADGRTWGATRLPTAANSIVAQMMVANCFVHSAAMFRRDAALALGGFPEDFAVAQDYALFSALMRVGGRLVNLTRPVVKLRTHPEQVMAGALGERERAETAFIVAENLAWLLGGPTDPELGETLRRLWSRGREPTPFPPDPAALPLLEAIFRHPRLDSGQRALLALSILGGRCDGRWDVRRLLLSVVLRERPTALLDRSARQWAGRALAGSRAAWRNRRQAARGTSNAITPGRPSR